MRNLNSLLAIFFFAFSAASAMPADTLWEKELPSYCIEFSPTEPILAVGTDKGVGIFDVHNGQLIIKLRDEIPNQNYLYVKMIDFSNDGKKLAVGTNKENLVVFNTQNWEVLFSSNVLNINDLDFSPDGLFLALACKGDGLRVYDTEDWLEIIHWQKFPKVGPKIPDYPWFKHVSFSYDSERIAFTLYWSESRYAWKGYIFDLATQELTDTLDGMVEDAQFSRVANELMALRITDFYNTGNWIPGGFHHYRYNQSKSPETFANNIVLEDFKWTDDGNFIFTRLAKYGKKNHLIKLKNQEIVYIDSFTSRAYDVSPDNKYLATGWSNIYMLKIQNYLGYKSPESSDFINIYPNPADDNIRIEFSLPESSEIELMIRDLFGNEIMNIEEFREAGTHYIDFDTNVMASGAYFVNLRIGNDIYTKQFEVVR